MKNETMGAEDLYLAPEDTKESDGVILSDTAETELAEMNNIIDASDKPKKLKRIEEIREQRGTNVKVFRMNDGTEQAVFSPTAIHVFDDETHTFEDVESTLTEDEDGRHFTCGKNHFVAKFSREEDNDDIFSIEQGMHKVTVCARKNKKNKNKGVKPLLRKNPKEGLRITDVLRFADVEPDTDYEYSVEGNGVKENIVVKKPARIYRYPFVLRCDNVTAQFDEHEKRISFVSNESGDEVFFIPTPFMTDANGITSTAVDFEVKTRDVDTVLLTVTADADWMNSPKRAFPVAIDPQIKLSGSASMSTYSWNGSSLFNASLHTIGTVATTTTYAASPLCDSDYTESASNSMKTAIAIALNSWKNGTIGCSGDEVWYKFVANSATAHFGGGAGQYTIYTRGSLDTMGYLYDSNGNLVASNDDSNDLNFSITANLNYGATYYLKVKAWSSNTGCYNVIIAPSADDIDSCTTCFNANRMYMSFAMPTLPRNPRIKKAELQVFQSSSVSEYGSYPLFGLYQVTNEIYTGACTPIDDSNLIDYARMRMGHCEDGEVISYTFDITTLVDKINKNESYSPRLVLKLLDESITSQNNITLYGSSYGGDYAPKIVITYESSYGVNTSYRTHTHELGRFGQGSVDLQCGNLMFESEDFAWAGNRMPVTIKHLYNSALSAYQYTHNDNIELNAADFTAMKLGYGFKLNIMQSIRIIGNKCIYTDENCAETILNSVDGVTYKNDGGDMSYNSCDRIMTVGDDTYQFDAFGRLIKITDASGNHMDITYTSNRITSVTDGAGREFGFTYNTSGQLNGITAPDDSKITYSYTGNLLTGITYHDGRSTAISYCSNKPTAVILKDSNGTEVYRVAYTFNGNRLASVTEYGASGSIGASSAYSYSAAARRTVVTTTEQADEDEESDNVIKTVYVFDDDGNVFSEYVYSEDTGNVGTDGVGSGINPHAGGTNVATNITNLLVCHNLDYGIAWHSLVEDCYTCSMAKYTSTKVKFGEKAYYINSIDSIHNENGMYQLTQVIPAGWYTFSAYILVDSAIIGDDGCGAYIRVTDTDGNVLAESDRLTESDTEYTRLITSFKLDKAQSVRVEIVIEGKGAIYADAAQLENNPFASPYNMVENGNFEQGNESWHYMFSEGNGVSTATSFDMSKSFAIPGIISREHCIYQTVNLNPDPNVRGTYTLSGWAKGRGLPNHEREDVIAPRFRISTDITDPSTGKVYAADFSPCTDEWQFASVQFSTNERSVRIYCDYDYNNGTAYFDAIQLVCNGLEPNVESNSYVDSDGTDGAHDTYKDTTPTFNEAKDKFGNALTETTFTDGDFGTIYRAFKFNEYDNCCPGDDAGNNLIEETDARGHKTTYTVDGDTSRNEEVIDRLGNKTAYEYDASGRTTKVISKNASGSAIANVSYAYDTFDNMTEIVRGDGMKYALVYNEFHNLESIGIDGKTEKLIHYTYKKGNGRLKQMTYANGDTMKATYNSIGQMVAEAWSDKNGVEIARYKYVYDGSGNIVRSIDIFAKKEYNYEYEEGRIVRATEADITLSGEIITSKDIVDTVKYYYDTDGKMKKKVITFKDGSSHTVYFENTDDNTTVKFYAGDRYVTSHSGTDSFGRKVFDELQLGTDFVSRQFVYHAGKVTTEHKEKAKVKSSATTQLVSQIILSDGRTLSYEYDDEERITKVIDSVDGTTEYTYDALGQLLTETVNGEVVNTMEYDNYGNILKKNGIVYNYGDSKWKDLLTGFDGKTIEYDAQGNPTSYLGHTLTWEKGRQLKSFDSNTYTYNANGIRTSKTVNGVLHTYTLDGTKILKEAWIDECYIGHSIVPLYDNEDSVCGILYNNVPYYFIKNLQGDIIAIVDKEAKTVARYSYDAWGVCTVTQDSVGIATINPFRYRGYYYDEEIGLYYVSSRYYDPEIGRWVNSDDSLLLGLRDGTVNYNLFAYCQNSPVNMIDFCGFIPYKIAYISIKRLTIQTSFSFTFTGSQLATTLVISAAVIDVICIIITAATGGTAAPVALSILGIVSVIFGLAAYLLDKYRLNQKYKVTISMALHLYKVRIFWRSYYGAWFSGLKVTVKKV